MSYFSRVIDLSERSELAFSGSGARELEVSTPLRTELT